MGKKNDNKDVFQRVVRGLAQRTPSAAELAKDAAREQAIQKEAKRIKDESDRIQLMLKRQATADEQHRGAELERRNNQK